MDKFRVEVIAVRLVGYWRTPWNGHI